MARSIYIVADYFPPMAAVGIHRTLALCRHLVERDWRVTVISARPTGKEAIDEGLLKKVPSAVQVVRAPAPDLLSLARRLAGGMKRLTTAAAVSAGHSEPTARGQASVRAPSALRRAADWLSWWVNVPDSRASWLAPAVLAALRQPRRGAVDVVFSSAPMWSSHLVAAVLARALRAPLVADFRDPWCGSAWRSIPWTLHQAVDRGMEQFVISTANEITCAWDGIRQHLVRRYPQRRKSLHTILNGFNPAELDAIEPSRLSQRCVLLHVGTFYGHRSPLPLLEALRHLRQQRPADAAALQVVQMGSPLYDGRPIEQLAREFGVAEQVTVLPARPHREALAALKGADVALLFGQSGGEQLASIPAKAYEYIGAGKAVLAVGAGQEVLDVLQRGGCRVWSSDGVSTAQLAERLREIVQLYRDNQLQARTLPASRLEFTQAAMAQRLEAVLHLGMRGH